MAFPSYFLSTEYLLPTVWLKKLKPKLQQNHSPKHQMDSFLVSLKVLTLYIQGPLQQIPFTQLALLLLFGGTVSLAYNLKKEINYLAERLNTVDIDVKCASTIARMCDDEIVTSRRDMDIIHSNMMRSIGLLELLNKVAGVNQKDILALTSAHTHDTTVYQQWYGVLKGETQYGELELTITVTNMEYNTRSQNNFWLKNNSNSDSYIDEIIQDIIISMSRVPFTHKESSVVRDSLGFSGVVRTRIEWNEVGRYYEVPEYFKKFIIQWEKRLVPI